MKKSVYIVLLILAVILAAAIIFSIGRNDDTLFPPESETDTPKEVSAIENKEEYMLIAESGRLNLYLLPESTAPFESEPIESGVFPKEDVKLLEKGIVFKNKEDAYRAMEDFIN